MRTSICLTAALALCACSKQAEAPPAADNNVTETNVPTPAALQLNETSWTYTMDGKNYEESVDASGNYVSRSDGKDVDHGTAVMKDGKACFTSAVDKKGGENCWTTQPVEVGQSMDTVSDKGEKLRVSRVAYVAPATKP